MSKFGKLAKRMKEEAGVSPTMKSQRKPAAKSQGNAPREGMVTVSKGGRSVQMSPAQFEKFQSAVKAAKKAKAAKAVQDAEKREKKRSN